MAKLLLVLLQRGFMRGFASTKLPGAETDALQVVRGPCPGAAPSLRLRYSCEMQPGLEAGGINGKAASAFGGLDRGGL